MSTNFPPPPGNLPPPYAPGPVPPPPPRRRSSNVFIVVGVVVGVVLLILALFCGFGAFYIYTAQEQPVTAGDRQVIVDAAALAEHMEDFTPNENFETISKLRYLDGSSELDYKYDAASADDEPFVNCTVSVESSESDARDGYRVLWMSTDIGMRIAAESDVKIVERKDFFRWGDDSRFGSVESNGFSVGNVFIARKGKKVFYLLFVGVQFDDPDEFSDLVMPALNRLDAYTP